MMLAGLGLAGLAGCSGLSRSAVDAARLALHRHPRIEPTAASVAAVPYAQLQVNAPDGQALLVLGSVRGDTLGWYGRDGQAVFLRHGVLVKTLGLPRDLAGMALDDVNPFAAGLQHVTAAVQYTRVYDWSPGYRFGELVQASLQPAGMEDVAILGTVHHLRRFDEHLQARDGSLDAVNRYWADPADGFIWKSRQYVAPGQPLELIQLKPYREPAA